MPPEHHIVSVRKCVTKDKKNIYKAHFFAGGGGGILQNPRKNISSVETSYK